MNRKLVLLLEEPSARELLKGVLPRLVPNDVEVHYIVFQGKSDLEAQLVRRIRGWRAPRSAFVVLRDQDSGDCRSIKKRLSELVGQSGRSPSLVRVACRELEAWVAGDLAALAQAFDRPEVASLSSKERFRSPDELVKPVQALQAIIPEYQKTDGARRVGPLLDPSRSQSKSFQVFCAGVRRLISGDS